ncbi:MAG: OmpA family protein [bacterium]|nr:OmpA family protein [bacterium]
MRRAKIAIILITIFISSASLYAGLFGPSDYEKCVNEKTAVETKLKYCYKDKVAAESELKKLKRQYKNEKANLNKRIQKLKREIDKLNKEIALLKKERAKDKKLCQKRIKGLQKTIAILRRKSGSRERQLIDENKKLQARYEAELKKIRQELQDERNKNLQEIAKLKKDYEDQIARLQGIINNLNEELAGLKKLTGDQKNELERLAAQERELEKQLQSEIEKGEIRLKKFHGKLIINIDNRISFDSGSARLKIQISSALNKISKILENYPENRIVVEGHTDDDKMRGGRFRDNWHLSTERALAVLRYILKNKNLDRSRFAAAGYGEFNPLVQNNSTANKALNRRVDIVVIPRVMSK